jgi:hypothetical protein
LRAGDGAFGVLLALAHAGLQFGACAFGFAQHPHEAVYQGHGERHQQQRSRPVQCRRHAAGRQALRQQIVVQGSAQRDQRRHQQQRVGRVAVAGAVVQRQRVAHRRHQNEGWHPQLVQQRRGVLPGQQQQGRTEEPEPGDGQHIAPLPAAR